MIGEKPVTLTTRRPKKTLAAPMVLRIDQLNSKKTGGGAMMVGWWNYTGALERAQGRGGTSLCTRTVAGQRALLYVVRRKWKAGSLTYLISEWAI